MKKCLCISEQCIHTRSKNPRLSPRQCRSGNIFIHEIAPKRKPLLKEIKSASAKPVAMAAASSRSARSCAPMQSGGGLQPQASACMQACASIQEHKTDKFAAHKNPIIMTGDSVSENRNPKRKLSPWLLCLFITSLSIGIIACVVYAFGNTEANRVPRPLFKVDFIPALNASIARTLLSDSTAKFVSTISAETIVNSNDIDTLQSSPSRHQSVSYNEQNAVSSIRAEGIDAHDAANDVAESAINIIGTGKLMARVHDVLGAQIRITCSSSNTNPRCGTIEPVDGCPDGSTGPTCTACLPSFFGAACTQSSRDCHGHGFPADGRFGDGRCICDSNWQGESCDICSIAHFGPQCDMCPDCTDIGIGICSGGLNGNGTCICSPGFEGELCNTCKAGFFGETCTECPTCSSTSFCADGINGSGNCTCLSGYGGDDCTECVDEDGGSCFKCERCTVHGTCDEHDDGSGTCICETGYAGENCEVSCDICDRNVCNESFLGIGCEQCDTSRFNDTCASCGDDCSRHGYCLGGINQTAGVCVCDDGWMGDECAQQIDTEFKSFNWCGNRRQIALTFDDGPSKPTYFTSDVVDELNANGIKGTFFISPAVATLSTTSEQCTVLQSLIEDGHSVQSHSWTHADLGLLDGDMIEQELNGVRDWVENCTQSTASSIGFNQLRPPFGSLGPSRARFVASLGYTISTWNVDAYDYDGGSLEERFARTIDVWTQAVPTGGSGIILMHEFSTLPGMVTMLYEHFSALEYEFVTTSECFESCTNGSNSTVCQSPYGAFPGVYL